MNGTLGCLGCPDLGAAWVSGAVGQPGFPPPRGRGLGALRVAWGQHQPCGTKQQPCIRAGGSRPGRRGADGVCPVPGQRRQPRALSSPPRPGCTLGCLCKPSLLLTAGLGHFSPPRTPYVVFSQCSLFKGHPGILFPPTALSLAWSQLPTPGQPLHKPQWVAAVNAVVCSVTQVGG